MRPVLPPQASRELRSFALALGVHALLFSLLFVGIRWQTQRPVAVQAELWAPAPSASPPVPAVAPPEPAPPPPPKPVEAVKPPPAPEAPALPKPDIVLEKQKERERRELEARKAEQARKEAERKEQARKAAEERKAEQARKEAERKEAEAKKAEQARREAERAQKEALAQEQRRDDYVKRLMSQAGTPGDRAAASSAGAATGAASGGATGAAAGDYGARLSSAIRANVVYQIPANLQGNPEAVFDVSVLPDCSVASVKLRSASGVTAWDQAAARAIQRTDPLPRPPAGTCPRTLEIRLRPREER